MKNIQSFEDFVNEGKLFEKKTFSPANIKEYDVNKNSVNALKSWSYKIKDIEIKFTDSEYFGNKPDFFDFVNGTGRSLWYTRFKCGDLDLNVTFDRWKNSLSIKLEANNYINFEIDENTFLRYVKLNDDKIIGFIDLLNFLFNKYSNEIYKYLSDKSGLQTLYVIKAGDISPSTGKTQHGWSIYDKTAVLGVTKNQAIFYNAEGMKVGDKFKIVDDQSHKLIFDEIEIIELVPTTYKDFVNLSKRKGAVLPVGAFQKQTGSFKFCLYSIK
jgi:hypothetical protein